MLVATTSASLPDWITAIAAGVGAIALVTGLLEYRVRRKAAEIEGRVKLLETFSALAPLADARDEAFLSEVVMKKLVDDWDPKVEHLDLRRAIANAPVATSRQAAVLAAIGDLSVGHKELREPAAAMLKALPHLAVVHEGDAKPQEVVRATYLEACRKAGVTVDLA